VMMRMSALAQGRPRGHRLDTHRVKWGVFDLHVPARTVASSTTEEPGLMGHVGGSSLSDLGTDLANTNGAGRERGGTNHVMQQQPRPTTKSCHRRRGRTGRH
jgi:hypothetical protein